VSAGRAAVCVVLAAACVGAAVSACAEPGPDPNQYLTPIAQAHAAGVPVYWLGKGFNTAGRQFPVIEGSYAPGFAGVNVLGVELDYSLEDDPGVKLRVSTMSAGEWQKARQSFFSASPFDATHSSDIRVAGHNAQLLSEPYGERPVNWRALVLDMGSAVVVAQTNAIGSALNHATKTPSTCMLPTPSPGVFAPSCPVAAPQTPGPDLNPLIDQATFIAVMQHLRPYPQ
jgi:hypothetical protein